MMVEVAAAIIEKDHQILICQRAEGGSCSLLWEFPGGKREEGETPEQCAVRECGEELGVTVRLRGIFAVTSYRYPEQEIHFTFFRAELAEGRIRKNVHKEIRWVPPAELGRYSFCPADLDIIRRLMEEG